MSNIEIVKFYNEELVLANPHKIYVFGDNLIRKGKAGQATIRDCPNSFGIPTKRLPSTHLKAYFNDQQDEVNAVVSALMELKVLWENGHTLVFPSNGLGRGLAKMHIYSPKLYEKMSAFLGKISKELNHAQRI